MTRKWEYAISFRWHTFCTIILHNGWHKFSELLETVHIIIPICYYDVTSDRGHYFIIMLCILYYVVFYWHHRYYVTSDNRISSLKNGITPAIGITPCPVIRTQWYPQLLASITQSQHLHSSLWNHWHRLVWIMVKYFTITTTSDTTTAITTI